MWCVVGANQLVNVMEEYLNRVWNNIHKVLALKDGMFLVRFYSTKARDQLLRQGPFFFDKKPVIMQPGHADLILDRCQLEKLPICVRFPELEAKCLGPPSLSKLGSLIGRPLKTYKPTMEKSKLGYARLLIEVDIGEELPEEIDLITEKGTPQKKEVSYEWRRIKCNHCKVFGLVSRSVRRSI